MKPTLRVELTVDEKNDTVAALNLAAKYWRFSAERARYLCSIWERAARVDIEIQTDSDGTLRIDGRAFVSRGMGVRLLFTLIDAQQAGQAPQRAAQHWPDAKDPQTCAKAVFNRAARAFERAGYRQLATAAIGVRVLDGFIVLPSLDGIRARSTAAEGGSDGG